MNKILGNSLAILWLGLCVFTAGAWVQTPVRNRRSRELNGSAKMQNNSSDQKATSPNQNRLNECHGAPSLRDSSPPQLSTKRVSPVPS